MIVLFLCSGIFLLVRSMFLFFLLRSFFHTCLVIRSSFVVRLLFLRSIVLGRSCVLGLLLWLGCFLLLLVLSL